MILLALAAAAAQVPPPEFCKGVKPEHCFYGAPTTSRVYEELRAHEIETLHDDCSPRLQAYGQRDACIGWSMKMPKYPPCKTYSALNPACDYWTPPKVSVQGEPRIKAPDYIICYGESYDQCEARYGKRPQ